MQSLNRFSAELCRRSAKKDFDDGRHASAILSLHAVDKSERKFYEAFSAFAPSVYMAKCRGRIAIRRSSRPLVSNAGGRRVRSPERP